VLTQLLEVVAAHPSRAVSGHRAQHGPAGGGGGQQTGPDPGEGEQGDHQTGGQPDPTTEDPADPGRGLVLHGDPDLAVGPPFDHRGVVGVDQPGLGVQILDQLVVGLGVGDVGIGPDIGHERVDRHLIPRPPSWFWASPGAGRWPLGR
jgi:hypothetical protein